MEEIQEAVRNDLQARFDSQEFYCPECQGQAQISVAFVLGNAPRGRVSKKHLSWTATGFCCNHLRDKADAAFGDANEKMKAAEDA